MQTFKMVIQINKDPSLRFQNIKDHGNFGHPIIRYIEGTDYVYYTCERLIDTVLWEVDECGREVAKLSFHC
jgi:hypothetical protein